MEHKLEKIEEEAQEITIVTHNIRYLLRLIFDAHENYFEGEIDERANIRAGLKFLKREIDELILFEGKHEQTILTVRNSL